jgi:hypothetical protein
MQVEKKHQEDGGMTLHILLVCFAALTFSRFCLVPRVLQCIDGRTTLALWELSDPDDEHSAKLTIKPAGMSIITEILTTLTLNLMAQTMGWPDA